MIRSATFLGLILVCSTLHAQVGPRFVSLDQQFQSLVTLEQNWTDEESNWFYNAAQGSRLLPYRWLLALEQPNSQDRFLAPQHIRKLGYLTRVASPDNPDALPIGFVKDAPYEDGTEGLGVTCAACHTGMITHQRTAYLIDGAPAMGDMEKLLTALAESLQQTAIDDEKFNRFARQLQVAENDVDGHRNLRETLKLVANERSGYNQRNLSSGQWPRFGHGRIDAFGAIFNEVTATFVGLPGNAKPANAPVSYPCLWDAPLHNRVQWNGAAENRRSVLGLALFSTKDVGALGRNSGEVLGVFGNAHVNDHELLLPRRYESTISKSNLLAIEDSLRRLWSPEWPAAFGALDDQRIARGEALYRSNCQECHATIDRTDPNRTITAHLSNAQTDQMVLQNFGRITKTGKLAGRRKTLFSSERFGNEESAAMILKHVVERVMLNPLTIAQLKTILESPISSLNAINPGFETMVAIKQEDQTVTVSLDSLRTEGQSLRVFAAPEVLEDLSRRLNSSESTNGSLEIPAARAVAGYKARPLNGIWATAPYLHNGSVRTLTELLKPAARRATTFHVGSTEYDTAELGFVDSENFPLFDASLPGNSNRGHEYGTELTEEEKRDLLEYLKSL